MRLLVPLVCLCAVLIAACGDTTIDSAEAEAFISKSVTDQIGARVESVECPDGLVAKKGATFDCTVNGDDGSSGEAKVTEKDSEGNVNVSAPFIHVRDLETRIVDGLSEQLGETVTLDCPEIVIGEKGGTFECDATAGGDAATILVTQKDDDGNVRYEVQQ